MSKHTPGPWKAEEEDSIEKGAITWRLTGSDGRYICYLCEGSDRPELRQREWMPVAEAEANARLIAAAPELLEACKVSGIVEVLDRIGNHAAARLFEAAIAKAEGQA